MKRSRRCILNGSSFSFTIALLCFFLVLAHSLLNHLAGFCCFTLSCLELCPPGVFVGKDFRALTRISSLNLPIHPSNWDLLLVNPVVLGSPNLSSSCSCRYLSVWGQILGFLQTYPAYHQCSSWECPV